MRALSFAKRNFKEIFRDPINLFFMIILPVFLLIIFQQFNIPSNVYKIENFAPGIIIFGYSFISLFGATLVSKDRSTSFLSRLFASPLTTFDFIMGYTISLLPIAFLQSALFMVTSLFFKLDFNINFIYTILISIFISLIFIGLSILIGCLFNDKQTPGVASIIVQLVAFTSGLWFELSMMSNTFQTICKVLPFKYCVDMVRNVLNSGTVQLKLLFIIIAFIIIIYIINIIIFKNKKISDNK